MIEGGQVVVNLVSGEFWIGFKPCWMMIKVVWQQKVGGSREEGGGDKEQEEEKYEGEDGKRKCLRAMGRKEGEYHY